jgi:hypothetical protein
MSLEPAIPSSSHELIAFPRSTGYFERRDLERDARLRLFEVQMDAVTQALRMSNASKLTMMQVELHERVGADITRRILATDNPLIQRALESAFENWLSKSNAIVSGLGGF